MYLSFFVLYIKNNDICLKLYIRIQGNIFEVEKSKLFKSS